MTVVDSCGWLAYFSGAPQADTYEPYVLAPDLLVPTVVLYEVYKVIRRDLSEEAALVAAAALRNRVVVPLDDRIALEAADVSIELGLPMADAIVYATTQAHGAVLVTGDAHFADLPGVDYLSD